MLLAVGVLAAEPSSEHRAPVETLAVSAQAGNAWRQALLSELRLRRVIAPDASQWLPEDLALLERMRAAEGQDAVATLRRAGGLAGRAVAHKSAGASFSVMRLTREGFDAWLGLRSRAAVDYFELKGVDAKWGFKLVSMEGKALFDGTGRLTPVGQDVYDRALANLPVWWKTPVGEIFGTRPASQALKPAAAEDPHSLPVTVGPEYREIHAQALAARGGKYEPLVGKRSVGRLVLIEEIHPSHAGKSRWSAVVGRESDRKAALRELKRRLPDLAGELESDRSSLMTVDEKLRAMETNLDRVDDHTGKKGYWKIDRAAIAKRLREDVRGALAVVYVFRAPSAGDAAPPVADEPYAAPPAAAPAKRGRAEAPPAQGKPSEALP